MPKVFIVSASGHDFTPAEKHGELIPLSRGTINKFHITKMLRVFDEKLLNSTHEDFILQSGPTIMNVVACGRFIALHGCLNLLIWRIDEDGTEKYAIRRLNFKEESVKDGKNNSASSNLGHTRLDQASDSNELP